MFLAGAKPPSALVRGSHSSAVTEPGFSSCTLRVLLIDDDESVREVVARWLRLQHFEVDVAADGEVGLARAIERTYDVVILDWRLPRLHGSGVLRGLRLAGVWVPVIVITQFSPDGAFEAAGLGAIAYLSKPLDFEALPHQVRQAASADLSSNRKPSPCLFSPCPVSGLRLAEARRALQALDKRTNASNETHMVRLQLFARLLCRALAATDVTVFEFVCVAKSLRLVSGVDLRITRTIMAQLDALFDEASDRSSRPMSPRLACFLDRVEAAGSAWADVDEQSVATVLRIDRSTLLRVITKELGLTFPGSRAIIVIRRAALKLADSQEYVQQVAYHAGFATASVMNHFFRRLLGVTPTAFRTLARGR